MVKVWSIAILFFLVATAIAQESGGFFNNKVVIGDMVLTRRQHKLLYGNDTIKRVGKSNKSFRWPGNIVPVKISPQFDETYKNTIKAAAAYISAGSCIKFDFDFSRHPVYLNANPADPNVCNAEVGYLGHSTTMKLDPKQCHKDTVVHELLHVLGFWHMISAPDRDNYITINFDNIEENQKYNYKKFTTDVSMFNTEYDLRSIMHYPAYAYAINNKIPTITLKGGRTPDRDMGLVKEMSPGDWKRLNRMYECPGRQ